MSERLVIDCYELYEKAVGQPGGLPEVHQWLRHNGINPNDVPLHSEMVIEDSAYGMVIRYTAYRRNADGNLYVDPDDPEFPASEDRTAVLRAAPLAQWLSSAGGAR